MEPSAVFLEAWEAALITKSIGNGATMTA